jgi:flavin-dependent dehydrogenase
MEHYDVVVVGAGLAGLECARRLAERSISVLLVDRKGSLTEQVHTTGIFVRRTLEDFDLPEDCLGPAISDVTLYSPRRRRMELHSPYPEFRIGKMGTLYERYLQRCLLAGVEWLPDTRFAEVQSVRGRLLVRLQNKTAYWVSSRFLIGGDGANSRVARHLQLDTNNEWIVGVEDVFTTNNSETPRLHCFVDPALAPGYLAWVALDGEEAHVGVGGYASRFDPVAALEKFRASLVGLFDLPQQPTERRAGRSPVGGVLKRIANERGLLIGDAAGAVSPLTAGGLDPCLRLSKLAADVTSIYLQTQNRDVLACYSGAAFRTRFTSRIWMRRAFARIRSRTAIEFGCAAMRAPVLRSVAWHVFFGRGSFPDVERVEASAAERTA